MWDGADVFSLILIVAIVGFCLGSFVGYNARGIGRNFSYRPRSYRPFRFLVAICLGVAGTLAWQSYGDATKQIIAMLTRATGSGG
jgi:hypothetical protein